MNNEKFIKEAKELNNLMFEAQSILSNSLNELRKVRDDLMQQVLDFNFTPEQKQEIQSILDGKE